MANMHNPEGVHQQQVKQQIADGFGRAAPTYDRVGPRFFSHFGHWLVELAELPQGAQVLDVATGKGAILFPATEHVGAQGYVIGIDLSEMMVQETTEEIRKRGVKNAEVCRMDAESLTFPDASFDAVLCGFALFFLPQLDHALSEFYRVLKPGGHIAVSTWGKDDTRWNWYGGLLKAYLPQPDAAPWQKKPFRRLGNEDELRMVLTHARFEQLRVVTEDTEFVYTDEEEWWAVQWSHGARYTLETMPPEVLTKFKTDVFDKMQTIKRPDGIPYLYTVLFTLGMKPSE